MKTKTQIKPVSSLLAPALLIVICILILRPRVIKQENNIKEAYPCKVTKNVENPRYKDAQNKWIDKCIMSKTGILKQSACEAESINAKYDVPMFIESRVEGNCERVTSIQKQYSLRLYALDSIYIKIYSTTQKIDYSSSETDSTEASNLIMSDPKVKEFFELSPDPHLTIENINDNDSFWNIHVYEDFPDHRVTFNWYEIDKQTGQITDRISTESNK